MSASCCGSARRTAALVVMAVALTIAVTGWGWENHRSSPHPEHPTTADTRAVPYEPGKDVLTVPFPWRGDVTAGTRVDVLGNLTEPELSETLTILSDVRVVAVRPLIESASQLSPRTVMVSLAVTQKQALLMMLARQKKCDLELLLRAPDSPAREVNWERVYTLLKYGRDRGCGVGILAPEPEVAPFPRAVP